MRSSDWALALAAAAAAALLLNAGLAKVASPDRLRGAVSELLPVAGRRLGSALVRGFGVAESAAAVGLLIAPVRLAAAIAAAALGVSFAALGMLGVARGSNLPCGCFGAAGQRPLGWANVWLGAALVLPWPLVAAVGQVPGRGYSVAAALFASIGTVLLCLWLNRRLIMRLRRADRTAPAGSGVN
jgi:methylamine utilization protein MauE